MSSKAHVTLCVRTPHDKSRPVRFGSDRYCGSEDIMFAVVEDEDSTLLSLKSSITVYL